MRSLNPKCRLHWEDKRDENKVMTLDVFQDILHIVSCFICVLGFFLFLFGLK